jgi:hypothetical protein
LVQQPIGQNLRFHRPVPAIFSFFACSVGLALELHLELEVTTLRLQFLVCGSMSRLKLPRLLDI